MRRMIMKTNAADLHFISLFVYNRILTTSYRRRLIEFFWKYISLMSNKKKNKFDKYEEFFHSICYYQILVSLHINIHKRLTIMGDLH